MGRDWQNKVNDIGENMIHTGPSRFFLLFLVAVSVFGLAVIPLFLLQSNLQIDSSPFRRPLVSAFYALVCVLGVVAVFYPGKCRLMFQKPKGPPYSKNSSASEVQFRGHHPDCEKFASNRITIGSSVFCAACSGLLIGAVVAILGIVLFSLDFFYLETGGLWVLVAGEVLMVVGLVQIKLRGYVKMVANALFVVGSCISLIVADLVGQNLLIDSYVLGLIIFMLWVRILISESNNKKTCLACGKCD